MKKRDFLKLCLGGLSACCLSPWGGPVREAQAQVFRKGLIRTRVSPYFESLPTRETRCQLCPFECRIRPGRRGRCRVRENRNGRLYSLVFGNPAIAHLDPIERNPFFHFLPGTRAFSLATVGCNFQCKFCQNWATSQVGPEEVTSMDFPPEQVIRRARDMGARSLAYSYVEPTVFIEFMMETAVQAKKAGIKNVYHSNGFINVKPLRDLCAHIDAANIDLKGFSEDFYRNLCGGELAPVLRTLKIVKEEGVHLEITNMVIPTQNDDPDLVRRMCLWIRDEIGPEVPVHFSRFYPLYKLKALPSTPVSTLDAIREMARKTGLQHVYIGNVPGHAGENTFCPNCGRIIIRRTGFMVGEIALVNGRCRHCNQLIHGVWQ